MQFSYKVNRQNFYVGVKVLVKVYQGFVGLKIKNHRYSQIHKPLNVGFVCLRVFFSKLTFEIFRS